MTQPQPQQERKPTHPSDERRQPNGGENEGAPTSPPPRTDRPRELKAPGKTPRK